ncbi:alpha/beta fold hydrolase [Salegentibacter sp. F188]|uniref:Alpha/beta fold hydrolase n=1 Tax=Autumnicola patrickiae TaxID=3075591 RepID=A0ABU3E5N6_9FLAO|nr:alpha/beta fold hydrolase [Salegentibacter sp. F188]MDT0691310.1 alpha/beta fold hydrolase [Salegentibacter sp. F188]
MEIKKNLIIEGKHGKPIVADLFFDSEKKPKPVVIFCHGYKGFKDWGSWNLMAEWFARKGYFFVKFNFSHNGTTPDNPTEFLNIEAFGDNNYTKELDDLQSVIDYLLLPDFKYLEHLDVTDINLIGHSRGGGITIIKAAEEKRITNLITFASVSDFGSRFPKEKELEAWKKKGVQYITNTRTKQQLPHHFQFYTNFKENEERLNIQKAAKKLEIPHLIVHGSSDTSVSIADAGNLFEWSPTSKLLLVENADHVFGMKHPWDEEDFSKNFKYVLDNTLEFMETDDQDLIDAYGD